MSKPQPTLQDAIQAAAKVEDILMALTSDPDDPNFDELDGALEIARDLLTELEDISGD